MKKKPCLESRWARQLIVERNTMGEAVNDVTVTLPSGETRKIGVQQVRPGIWRGKLEASEAGLHRLSDGKLEAVAAIGTVDPAGGNRPVCHYRKTEPASSSAPRSIRAIYLGKTATAASMALPRIARVNAGRSMAGSGWLGLKTNNAYRILSIRRVPDVYNAVWRLQLCCC